MPEVVLYISKENKTVRKFIETELMLYIYSLNFANWDFYISNYLVSYKDFRNFLSKIFSKAKTKFFNKTISNRDINDNTIFSSEVKILEVSEKDETFSYMFSNSDDDQLGENNLKHQIHIMHSFNLAVKPESGVTQNFKFNFAQMKILAKLSECRDLNAFCRNLLIFSNTEIKISLDYSFFKDIDELYYKISKNLYKNEIDQKGNAIKLDVM
jgi:hypothetical protein